MTGAIVTAGGGGAGFSSLEEHPAREANMSSRAHNRRSERRGKNPQNVLLSEESSAALDAVPSLGRRGMLYLDFVVIRLASEERLPICTMHAQTALGAFTSQNLASSE
jgi:hypothetical protein